MYKMSEFTRAPDKVNKFMVEQEDDSMYCTRPCSVIIPKRWLNTRLAMIEDRFFIVAIFMLKVGKDYGIWNTAGVIELGLGEYQTVMLDGVECLEFLYETGELVIKNRNAPVDNTLPYYITSVITKKGSIVPYLSYDDFVRIPETFPKYCNLSIPNYAYVNIYMSYVCRAKEDKRKRANLSKKGEYINIPLNSVQLAVENTLNKFSGGNLDEGIQSALMHKSDKASMSEVVLRS